MRKELLIGIGIGLVALIAVATTVMWVNKGSHVVLEGSIQTVRTQDLDGASVMVVDFRATNPSNYAYVVREVKLILDLDGQKTEGAVVADMDAKKLFEYYPALGQKFNDTMKMRDKVQPKETVDRMVMVRFEAPEAKIKANKGVVVRIEEVDGLISELKQ
jgi:hypothetical protein